MSTPAARRTSWTEVILGAVLSLLLGAVLAAAFLVLQPVATRKAPPKEDEAKPGEVWFIAGTRDTARAREAAAKTQAFLSGASVVLNEDEVNAIVASGARPADAPAGRTAAAGEPNFRIRDGRLQIGVPLTFSVLGFERTVIAQVRGGFVQTGTGFALSPDEFYLGGCPLHRLPLVSGLLFSRAVASAPIPPEVAQAWSRLSDVAVEGATLRLTAP
jgi:hypothetical protein